MITVSLLHDQAGPIGFRCEGHAGWAQDDQDDVVCAAVTAIAGTTVTGLTDVLELEVQYDFQPGLLTCVVVNHEGKKELVTLLFQVFEIGCKQIEYSYGSQFVHVTDPLQK